MDNRIASIDFYWVSSDRDPLQPRMSCKKGHFTFPRSAKCMQHEMKKMENIWSYNVTLFYPPKLEKLDYCVYPQVPNKSHMSFVH